MHRETVWGVRELVNPRFVKPAERQDLERLDPVLRMVCETDSEDFFYGFPYCDSRLFIRAVLEVSRGFQAPDHPQAGIRRGAMRRR